MGSYVIVCYVIVCYVIVCYVIVVVFIIYKVHLQFYIALYDMPLFLCLGYKVLCNVL